MIHVGQRVPLPDARRWYGGCYTIVWAGRGKDIPLLLIVHSLGCFVNKKTES